MTTRLYYDNPYLTHFEAEALQSLTVADQPAVILDRSAFYPTSGGQPHDRGWLNGVAVVDVQILPGGEVAHLLAMPLPPGPVRGEIDWARRYDYMQQHTGQHLLSQAFWRVLGIESLSVHFGEAYATLEIDAAQLSSQELAQVEDHVNQIIWQNRPIRAYWVKEAEIDQIPLRLPPKVSGDIRIVEIQDYDWTACGGTHLGATGELGQIALLKVERIRQQVRVHFVCGGRALGEARQRRSALDRAAHLLDNAWEEVPDLVEKLLLRQKEADRQIRAMQGELLTYRAGDLLEQARSVGDLRLVTGLFPEMDAASLKGLAQALVREAGVVALLCCGEEKGTALFARSGDVTLHMGQILRRALQEVGGSGGGRPELAQGGFPASAAEAVINAAAGMVEEMGRGPGSVD